MPSPLPAEKTHYRKGLALGLTLAETFSIVVFVLLLACAALLRFEQIQRDAAEAQRDTAREDLLLTQELVRDQDMSWGNANAWMERSRELMREREEQRHRADAAERELASTEAQVSEAQRQLEEEGVPIATADRLVEQAAELQALSDSLVRTASAREDAEARADSLETRSDSLEVVVESVAGEPAEGEETEPPLDELLQRAARVPDLEDSLNLARSTISALDREIQAAQAARSDDSPVIVDSLLNELVDAQLEQEALEARSDRAERERDDAMGRANYWERQIRSGIGIDPPPCWIDPEGGPEHIFRIELTDAGLRLVDISPEYRAVEDSVAMRHARVIDDQRIYDPATFLRLTQPFYDLGVSRTDPFGPLGCRFWIQPVDLTGDRKNIFRERESQLWRHFWFRW